MNEKKSDWGDLQLFLAVAREGGLSAAAKYTGRSPATLGRRMLALERSLGQELFIRHDRGYELTQEARALLEQMTKAERLIASATQADQANPVRRVKISAGTWMTLFLLSHFDRLLGPDTGVRLQFISAEAYHDITHREVAIGIRSARPDQSGLAGRKLRRVEFAPYGRPEAPQRWIKVIAETPSAKWLDARVGDDAFCEVTSPRNALDLALDGYGWILLPTFLGETLPEIERKGLTIPALSHDQWLVTHQDDRYHPEIRQTIDRLFEIFSTS